MIVTLTLKVNQVLGGGESGRRSCHASFDMLRRVKWGEVSRLRETLYGEIVGVLIPWPPHCTQSNSDYPAAQKA